MGLHLRVIAVSVHEWMRFDAFIRSSNKMPMAVRAAIKGAAVKVGGMSEEEAIGFLGLMERGGRLIEETWS
jgi:hypothetical protein